jgi:hypothetical protein
VKLPFFEPVVEVGGFQVGQQVKLLQIGLVATLYFAIQMR